jgi:ADP-ribosylglycohydrolase
MKEDAFIGCLLGTAVGDSLGLPYEGLSPQRAAKLFPDTTKHHFFFGKGMVSDDTEHACFVAQAIIRSKGDVEEFQNQLARSLRWWLLGLPAGIGFATLRSIIKLWFGIPGLLRCIRSRAGQP